jgi:hypothetical protein
LFLDISFYCFPVSSFSDSCYIVPIGPELTTPEVLFDGRLSTKYLPGCDAFEDLHDMSWRQFGMGTTEKVDMISVHAHHLDLNLVSFFYTDSCFSYDLHGLFIQQGFSVLHGKHDMVMNLPSTMVSFSDSTFDPYQQYNKNKAPLQQAAGNFQVRT